MLSSFTRRPTRTVTPATGKPTRFVDAAIEHLPNATPAQVAAPAHVEEDDESHLPYMLRRDWVAPETPIPVDLPHGQRPSMPRQLGARGGRK